MTGPVENPRERVQDRVAEGWQGREAALMDADRTGKGMQGRRRWLAARPSDEPPNKSSWKGPGSRFLFVQWGGRESAA